MISYLAEFEGVFGPLRLFRYITVRSMGGAATAFLIGMWLAPWMIARLRAFKLNQSLRTAEQVGALAALHSEKKKTPTMGGLIIFIAVAGSILLWARWNVYVGVALMVYAGLTVIGFADDYLKVRHRNSRGLPGRYKLLGQFALSIAALWWLLADPLTSPLIQQLWLPFLKYPLVEQVPWPLLLAFVFVVVAGSSNAINLTDGVDGLAIGCTVTAALAYGLMAYATSHAIYASYLLLPFLNGAGELTVVCAILCAGSLAFLWYNAHPAMVFMGDTGSLALGGLLGIIAFMILQPFTLVVVGGIFVMEAASVILQVGSFKSRGKRIFRMAPIHHHFELGGWAETQVVIRFWILSLIFAIIGLATLKLR
jgi:phospho-N-acetylmuramoyl-pentapeptide-transferase